MTESWRLCWGTSTGFGFDPDLGPLPSGCVAPDNGAPLPILSVIRVNGDKLHEKNARVQTCSWLWLSLSFSESVSPDPLGYERLELSQFLKRGPVLETEEAGHVQSEVQKAAGQEQFVTECRGPSPGWGWGGSGFWATEASLQPLPQGLRAADTCAHVLTHTPAHSHTCETLAVHCVSTPQGHTCLSSQPSSPHGGAHTLPLCEMPRWRSHQGQITVFPLLHV